MKPTQRKTRHGAAPPPQETETPPPPDNTAGTSDQPGLEREDVRWRERRRWIRLATSRRRAWTPWLLIRYKSSPPGQPDLGLRPIPSGEPFWISPDIWVESSDPFGNAVAGEENFVHARIFNLGKQTAAPTQVDFYWADPSLGLGPATMVHIGTEWVEVQEHTARSVRCNTPWVPVFLNNGHECLMVNCSNPMMLAPGVTHTFPPLSDPITFPFQPRLDRHVGQRNITVIKAKPGEMKTMSLVVNNLFPLATRVRITARVEHVTVAETAFRQLRRIDLVNHIAAFGSAPANSSAEMAARFREGTPEHREAALLAEFVSSRRPVEPFVVDARGARSTFSRNAACLSAEWTEHSCSVPHASAGTDFAHLLLMREKLALPESTDIPGRELLIQESELDVAQQRRLLVQFGIPAGARPGDFLVFHLTQRMEGLLTGGYTVVVPVLGGVAGPAGH